MQVDKLREISEILEIMLHRNLIRLRTMHHKKLIKQRTMLLIKLMILDDQQVETIMMMNLSIELKDILLLILSALCLMFQIDPETHPEMLYQMLLMKPLESTTRKQENLNQPEVNLQLIKQKIWLKIILQIRLMLPKILSRQSVELLIQLEPSLRKRGIKFKEDQMIEMSKIVEILEMKIEEITKNKVKEIHIQIPNNHKTEEISTTFTDLNTGML